VRYAKLQTKHLERHLFMFFAIVTTATVYCQVVICSEVYIHNENEISTGSKITSVTHLIRSLKRKNEFALMIAYIYIYI
jgi:hypothetical protein